MEDMTGKPRSDKDLEEAIQAMAWCQLNAPSLPPKLVIMLMTIKDLLKELQHRRSIAGG